jgi:hypothetical protein
MLPGAGGRIALFGTVIVLAIAASCEFAGSARAEALSGLASTCPYCDTADGGARAINLFRAMGGTPQGGDGWYTPTDASDYMPDGGSWTTQAQDDLGAVEESVGTDSGLGGALEGAGVAGGGITGLAALGTVGLAAITAGVWVHDGHMLFHYLFDDSSGGPDPTEDFGSNGEWQYTSNLASEGFSCAADTFDGPNCPTSMPSGPGLVWIWHDSGGQTRQDVTPGPAEDTCQSGVPAPWYGTQWSDAGWTQYCELWTGNSWQWYTFSVRTYFATVSEGGVPVAGYPDDGSVTPPSGADVITAKPPYQMPPYYPEPDRSTTAQQLSAYLQSHPALANAVEHAIAPVQVPAIQEGETPTAYASDLAAAGLQSHVVTMNATDTTAADGDVVEADPEPGTEVSPGTTVEVAANPSSPSISEPDERCDVDNGEGAPGSPGNPPSDGTNYPFYQTAPGTLAPYTATVDPTNSSPPQTTIPLRWGTTGWGWTHILLKHPYTSADEQQTMQALATDANPQATRFTRTNQWDFRYFYDMPDGVGGTIVCVRTARVEYYQDPKALAASVSGIRGIQNSFAGLYLGGVPGH